MKTVSALVVVALLAGACGGANTNAPVVTGAPAAGPAAPHGTLVVTPELKAIVDAQDRTADDRALDAGRKPAELLAFAGIKPGMKVADLATGSGYTAELLARAVGPSGTVYAQNNAFVVEKFAKEPWAARLATPANNVVRVVREADEPLPPEATNLDAVVCVLFYHDLFWLGADRTKLNAAVHKALKPGGVYIIVDHSGRAGTAATEVKTLHRIEEKLVRDEITAAGFKLDAEGDFLRAADDKRDWNASPMGAGERRGHSDRFVLKLVKN